MSIVRNANKPSPLNRYQFSQPFRMNGYIEKLAPCKSIRQSGMWVVIGQWFHAPALQLTPPSSDVLLVN